MRLLDPHGNAQPRRSGELTFMAHATDTVPRAEAAGRRFGNHWGRLARLAGVLALVQTVVWAANPGETLVETAAFRFHVQPETGRYEVLDKAAGVTWQSNPYQARFGEVVLWTGGKQTRLPLARCEARRAGEGLELIFHPLAEKPDASLRVRVQPVGGGQGLEFSYEADPALGVEAVRLLDDALWCADITHGYAVVPVREGLLVPADSGLRFNQRFGTYDYEGCHMEMAGVVKEGAAVLITWHDPYVALELKSVLTNAPWAPQGQQVLSPSLTLRKSARAFRLQFLGRGDYGSLARAYRPIAQERGWRVTWDDKLKGHPERAKLFGAVNFKLWSALTRRMNAESTREESVRVNWTFDEAAQIAEHFKKDLQLEKVFFLLGGWIHRGYDCQHPDILPTAPECGGDRAFAECARRVRDQGYVFGLHDNYQDIYRDSPSWNEDLIMKNAEGGLMKGGHWDGGTAYLTCSQKAVDLAKRPQNLAAVKQLCGADAYFIDTTYAAGLYECFDKNHPLTKWDDLKWKQEISHYARGLFSIYGSECGREWALPCADYFEGLTGVAGSYYHNKELLKSLGASVVPLFEMVYRDCIALYGKYGYNINQSADYVLHHLAIGRTLNYHNVPSHLYWKNPEAVREQPLRLWPAIRELKPVGSRRFAVTYRWNVEQPPAEDWRVFVHFTDAGGAIKFQNDHAPEPALSQWKTGPVDQGPFTVTVPEGLTGTFQVRIGLFDTPASKRALLIGAPEGDRSLLLGQLRVSAERIEFEPSPGAAPGPVAHAGLFVRADQGWAEGLHSWDRFMKNTYEVLSPLNELTARLPLTRHQFLTPDRKVQRSVFGEGAGEVEAVVNQGGTAYRHRCQLGGEVELPPYGFVVDSATFAAFHASRWGGLTYTNAPLFTLRSLDHQPLARSSRVRVYHGFGDPRLALAGTTRVVARESSE